MEYKILEAEGVENENIDGAAFNNFTSRGIDGRMKGVLNECNVYLSDSTTVVVDTGELLIHGFRVKITSPYSVQRTSSASSITYQIVAKITLSADRSVLFGMECRLVTPLTQNTMFSTESGIYEVEVAQFTTDSTGISGITYVMPIIGQPEILTEEYISSLIDRIWSDFKEKEHPIHSLAVYIDDTNPAELYGGYWLKIKDAFLWCSGDTASITYTKNGVTVTESLAAGERGGEMSHTLTISEMPNHGHGIAGRVLTGADNAQQIVAGSAERWGFDDDYNVTFIAEGGGQSHNIMPQYFAVNAWVRVTEEEFNANESL